MSRLDEHALFDLKLFFASLEEIRSAVEKILVAPPLARIPILHFHNGPLDLDWVDGQIGEWGKLKGRLWGVFYRPMTAPQTVRLLIHIDTFSYNIPAILKCDAVFIRSTGEASGFEIDWPIQEFEYYDHGESRRIVRVMDDERWEFFERGERFDWEYADQYRRRRKKDRVTRKMIVDYTRQFGVDLKDDSFWQSEHDALYWHYDFPPTPRLPIGQS